MLIHRISLSFDPIRKAGTLAPMQRKRKRITSRRWCRGSEETNGGDLTSALSMSQLVGWDRGADRASNDADVSSIPPIIPYGGFSPVRLEGRRIRRDLPGASISLSLLPACASRRPVCLHPSCTSEALLKCSEVYRFLFHTSCVPENANLRNVVCLLRTRGKRPSRRRTTEKRDELAAGASIT